MRLEMDPARSEVVATLSERNVRALYAKVAGHPAGSARTLTKVELVDGRYCRLVVRVEDDDTHYGSRGYPPGELDAETEAAL